MPAIPLPTMQRGIHTLSSAGVDGSFDTAAQSVLTGAVALRT